MRCSCGMRQSARVSRIGCGRRGTGQHWTFSGPSSTESPNAANIDDDVAVVCGGDGFQHRGRRHGVAQAGRLLFGSYSVRRACVCCAVYVCVSTRARRDVSHLFCACGFCIHPWASARERPRSTTAVASMPHQPRARAAGIPTVHQGGDAVDAMYPTSELPNELIGGVSALVDAASRPALGGAIVAPTFPSHKLAAVRAAAQQGGQAARELLSLYTDGTGTDGGWMPSSRAPPNVGCRPGSSKWKREMAAWGNGKQLKSLSQRSIAGTTASP